MYVAWLLIARVVTVSKPRRMEDLWILFVLSILKKQSQLSKLALLREKVIKLIIGFGHQSLANTCQNSAEHSFAVVLRIAVVGLAAS